MNQLANTIQIGIKYLIFQNIIFSSKFRHTAPRLEFLHLGKPLKLGNVRKCIMRKFFASIHTASLVLTETQNIPIHVKELPVWSGGLSWHLKMIVLQSNNWKAHPVRMGNDEVQYYRNSHFSLEMLYRINSMDRGALALVKKLFGLLQVKDFTPLGFSQQYEAQEFYLYTNLPHDRNMAPSPPRNCCECHGALPRNPVLFYP